MILGFALLKLCTGFPYIPRFHYLHVPSLISCLECNGVTRSIMPNSTLRLNPQGCTNNLGFNYSILSSFWSSRSFIRLSFSSTRSPESSTSRSHQSHNPCNSRSNSAHLPYPKEPKRLSRSKSWNQDELISSRSLGGSSAISNEFKADVTKILAQYEFRM